MEEAISIKIMKTQVCVPVFVFMCFMFICVAQIERIKVCHSEVTELGLPQLCGDQVHPIQQQFSKTLLKPMGVTGKLKRVPIVLQRRWNPKLLPVLPSLSKAIGRLNKTLI